MKQCYFCGRVLDLERTVGRNEICPQCKRDLRCCLNCGMYDPGASNQCKEPQSEGVRDRDRSNFCEMFVFTEGGAEGEGEVREAREQWESLFKKT